MSRDIKLKRRKKKCYFLSWKLLFYVLIFASLYLIVIIRFAPENNRKTTLQSGIISEVEWVSPKRYGHCIQFKMDGETFFYVAKYRGGFQNKDEWVENTLRQLEENSVNVILVCSNDFRLLPQYWGKTEVIGILTDQEFVILSVEEHNEEEKFEGITWLCVITFFLIVVITYFIRQYRLGRAL